MKAEYDRESCCALLALMQQKLTENGEARFPKRSDFSEAEEVAIKAFLGPWPRALEAAGLKPARDGAAGTRGKRICAKRRRRQAEGRSSGGPEN